MTPTTKTLLLMSAMAFAGPAAAQTACADLTGFAVDAAKIGLPTSGAVVDIAIMVAADDAFPAFCRITGRVNPADPAAPPILFQLNLPEDWNGKAVQMGGGGLNGRVIDGLGNLPGTAGGVAQKPLARGYVTFGSDSGHQDETGGDASFGLNREALENYGGAAVKRLHDAVLPVIEAHYGKTPDRMYHVGGSKGGHEGLAAAQRYGTDYDGIVVYYPAKDTSGLILGWLNMIKQTYGVEGAAIPPEKQALIKDRALAACDALDGLSDGVIANTNACAASFSPRDLACEVGANNTSACMTPAQVGALASANDRYTLPVTLSHGVTQIGPFPALMGGDNSGIWLDKDGTGQTTPIFNFVQGVLRYFWTGDAKQSVFDFDPATQTEGMLTYSSFADTNSTDISDFVGNGGKLILVQGTTDMLVPPSTTTDWFTKTSAVLGAGAGDSIRYYIQPGYGHGFGTFNLGWDSLTALDTWVETGTAPQDPIATDGNTGATRQMPLCEYPAFPRYTDGDPNKADSFVCAVQ